MARLLPTPPDIWCFIRAGVRQGACIRYRAPTSPASVEPLESRRLLASSDPIAINFNDEALWGTHFAASVAAAKSLGVTAVRLWFGFDYYDARPNAWDPVSPFGSPQNNAASPGEHAVDPGALVMKRAFQLHQLGFSVMLVLQQNHGVPPKSTDQVRRLVDFLMASTETPSGKQTLADAVDYWEIGNEPDSATFWKPSGANKAAGLQSYVDRFLIPAAQELHADPAHLARVVSAGVSYNPADLRTILNDLAARHALADIDFAGFHAYGTYDPANPDAPCGLKANAELAVRYAADAGKRLMATEWNVRGVGHATAADAQTWARAMDGAYRNVIAPNFAIGYYFALINNWPARGGAISARPGGVLMHDTDADVTPGSPVDDLAAYYQSPLVRSRPFYDTFASWQYGTVAGRITDQTASAPAGVLRGVRVYIDRNNNGRYDPGEPTVMAYADGQYSLKFSSAAVRPGDYAVRIATPKWFTVALGDVRASLSNLRTTYHTNFVVRLTDEPTAKKQTNSHPPAAARRAA